MNEWAPIVHGRTAFVDFRAGLVVVPRDFTPDDVSWARKYILSTTRWPEELPDGPLWSVFQNDRLLVAGVTCMARDVSLTMTRELAVVDGREVERRDLFVFLGYVARRPIGEIPRRNIDQFRPLYRFIEERWREQWYDSADSNSSDAVFTLECEPAARPSDESLTQSEEMIAVWPDDQQNKLWSEAPSRPASSLCIGIPNLSGLRRGSFNNVIVRGGTSAETLLRSPAETTAPPQPPARAEAYTPPHETLSRREKEPRQPSKPRRGFLQKLKRCWKRLITTQDEGAAATAPPMQPTAPCDECPPSMPLIRFDSKPSPPITNDSASGHRWAKAQRFRKRERETREGEPWEGWGNDDSTDER